MMTAKKEQKARPTFERAAMRLYILRCEWGWDGEAEW